MLLKYYLKKNFPRLKEAVEDRLETKLEEVSIKPLYSLIEEAFYDMEKESKKEVGAITKNIYRTLFYPFSFFLGLGTHAAFYPKNSNVYYSSFHPLDCIVPVFLGSSFFMNTSIHELLHATHLKIVGEEHFINSSEELREGFATYMTRTIMKEDFNKRLMPLFLDDYSSQYKNFAKRIKKHNLSTAKDFKKYLLNAQE